MILEGDLEVRISGSIGGGAGGGQGGEDADPRCVNEQVITVGNGGLVLKPSSLRTEFPAELMINFSIPNLILLSCPHSLQN